MGPKFCINVSFNCATEILLRTYLLTYILQKFSLDNVTHCLRVNIALHVVYSVIAVQKERHTKILYGGAFKHGLFLLNNIIVDCSIWKSWSSLVAGDCLCCSSTSTLPIFIKFFYRKYSFDIVANFLFAL